MKITIDHVIPVFLEQEKIKSSGVWDRAIVFNPGERIQVVAPSGSGKTSFIHFIYGMRSDFTGAISFDKKNIASFSREDFSSLRTSGISIIFQDLRLFPEHTVRRNIEIKRLLSPLYPESSVMEMVARLGISNKLDMPVKNCSYGEQQRIAIIRALQQPFKFLIMDEPFSHLDENNRKIATALLEEEAAKRNAGIILADLKRVEYFNADQILNL